MDQLGIEIDWALAINEAAPCGANTEFDTVFAEMEVAATATEEQQYGDTVIARKEPDWQQVLGMTLDLLQRTRDLRVQLLMTRALTRMHGLPGLLYGLASVRVTARHFWDSVHPQITTDGESDPHLRFNALCNFADVQGLVADARQCEVLTTPLGTLTVRDLERLQDGNSVELNGLSISEAQVANMLGDMRKTDGAAALALPDQVLSELALIQAIAREHLASEFHPDLSALARPLQKACKLLQEPGPITDAPAANGHEATDSPQESTPLTRTATGVIASRRDAVAQLEAVCRYLERSEPTNPAQLMIRRAMTLMEMNFMDILKHLAPEGLTQASFVTGIDPTDAPPPR